MYWTMKTIDETKGTGAPPLCHIITIKYNPLITKGPYQNGTAIVSVEISLDTGKENTKTEEMNGPSGTDTKPLTESKRANEQTVKKVTRKRVVVKAKAPTPTPNLHGFQLFPREGKYTL